MSTDFNEGRQQPKLALFMIGNSASILRRFADFLDWEISAICPNFQAYKEAKKEARFCDVSYLYEGFNQRFDEIDVEAFCARYASFNLSEVVLVDKTHLKAKSGEYQLRYACAMGEQIAEVLARTRPDYLFFPIIETVESMLAYRLAQHYGIRPIIYCHTRFTGQSFFSESHLELLPRYYRAVKRTSDKEVWAEQFLRDYRSSPTPFQNYPKQPQGEIYDDVGQDVGVVARTIRNLRLKRKLERHNHLINFWISFQVRFQAIFLPVRNFGYRLFEKYFIRPQSVPEGDYDFFPLHFSPESSINVPAPFYIDQIRVIDRILLDRPVNRPLVLKEHPAMFGFRPRGFFRDVLSRPFVQLVPRTTRSIQLIRGASAVYSVTGTACLEAFFLGVPWVQLGENFLSAWAKEQKNRSEPVTAEEFLKDVLGVSSDFTLYSPNRSASYDRLLFSKENVKKICDHLRFHIEQTERMDGAAPVSRLLRQEGMK